MEIDQQKIKKLTIQKVERINGGAFDSIDVHASAAGLQVGANFYVTQTIKSGGPLPDDLIERAEKRIRELLEEVLQDLKA